MAKLEIDMYYFDSLKDSSLEELIELRDNPRPCGVEDDEINLWIGRKSGDWITRKDSYISKKERTYLDYLKEEHIPSEDVPF